MKLFQSCKALIGFDDRPFVIIGIVLVSLIIHPIMTGIPIPELITSPLHLGISIIWTSTYWIILRQLMILLRQKFNSVGDTSKRILITAIIVTIAAPLVSHGLQLLCNHVFNYDILIDAITKYTLIYILVFGIFAVYEAVYYFKQYRQAIQETERLKTAQVQTQLENLRNQISPHFLFNSLNTLMNLIPKDQERAMSYLSKLSKFYRYTVSNQDESLISIQTEVENARTFSDLLKERFGENINIEIDCTLGKGKMILPLSLQLLIENAVKHNIVSKSKPLNINIKCTEERYLNIENNLQRKIQAVTSTGIGLENIKKRFAYLTDRKVIIQESKTHYLISLPLIDRA